jgi:hypothetical protein
MEMNTVIPLPAETAPATRLIGLRILLAVVALLETADAHSIAWAARSHRLGISATLVSIPTLFNVAAIAAFAVG